MRRGAKISHGELLNSNLPVNLRTREVTQRPDVRVKEVQVLGVGVLEERHDIGMIGLQTIHSEGPGFSGPRLDSLVSFSLV